MNDFNKLLDDLFCTKIEAKDEKELWEMYENARKTINEQISDISYGITQNWNYNKEITVGNKTYKPYGSDRDLAKYNSFINALGKEEHCKNVNYILYKYAYKPAGFEWGGNWGRNGNSGTYNGMQFYVKY